MILRCHDCKGDTQIDRYLGPLEELKCSCGESHSVMFYIKVPPYPLDFSVWGDQDENNLNFDEGEVEYNLFLNESGDIDVTFFPDGSEDYKKNQFKFGKHDNGFCFKGSLRKTNNQLKKEFEENYK